MSMTVARPGDKMYWGVVVILILLSILGLSGAHAATLGGFVHLAVLVALALLLVRILEQQRA